MNRMEVHVSLDHRAALDADTSPTDRALSLMHAGVPLSLLLDLAMPVHSADLYAEEPADTTWVPSCVA
jgi:hypothetical protein